MIWIIALILSALTFGYLFAGSNHQAAGQPDEELGTYGIEVNSLEKAIAQDPDNAGLKNRLVQLQRQMLATNAGNDTFILSRGLIMAIIAALSLTAMGLYFTVGSPELSSRQALTQIEAVPETQNVTLTELSERMAAQLAEDPEQPLGWVLYGRTLITLGQYDEGLAAYDKAVQLDPENQGYAAERDRAREFAASRPAGPTADQVEAAANMSAEDRQAMILSMVDGLAARLAENPNDPEGWIRLLRARKVLGQSALIEADMETIELVFSERPEIRDQILSAIE